VISNRREKHLGDTMAPLPSTEPVPFVPCTKVRLLPERFRVMISLKHGKVLKIPRDSFEEAPIMDKVDPTEYRRRVDEYDGDIERCTRPAKKIMRNLWRADEPIYVAVVQGGWGIRDNYQQIPKIEHIIFDREYKDLEVREALGKELNNAWKAAHDRAGALSPLTN
jgi:hypothetical protein